MTVRVPRWALVVFGVVALTGVGVGVGLLLAGGSDDESDAPAVTEADTDEQESSNRTGEEPSEPASPANSLADRSDALEQAGFRRVKATRFKEPGLDATGAVEAYKDEAHFTAAEFATPGEATQAERKFGFLEKDSFPVEVIDTTLFYAVKCCTDSGPPPIIPQSDFEAFKAAID